MMECFIFYEIFQFFFMYKGQHESNHKKLLQEHLDLQHKHTALNEQLGKVFKENAEMILLLKEKEQVGVLF